MSLELLHSHLNGEALSADQANELSAWLCASPEHAATAAELMHLDVTLADYLQSRATRPLVDFADDADWSEKLDTAVILTLMQEVEDNADPVIVSTDVPKPRKLKANFEGMPTRELFLLSGYAAMQALKTPAGIVTGIAAALLMSVGLFFAFSGGGTSTGPQAPVAATPSASSDTPLASPVATLTAERDAVWDRRPGQDLFAGQRFVLTQGFAEITTRDGAVAIIEAPATVELVESPNALRLHAGKLVGICETESSKGFVVHTPHMDITDLGTRFGVDASADGRTEVLVVDGEVRVSRRADSGPIGEPLQLLPGDAVLASNSENELARVELSPTRFKALLAFRSLSAKSAPPGLVAHWPFDESDRLGLNAHRDVEDLEVQGDATYTPRGVSGGALVLDGDEDGLVAEVFPQGVPIGNAPHSVTVWIKPTAMGRRAVYHWGSPEAADLSGGVRLGERAIHHYFWQPGPRNDLIATEQVWTEAGISVNKETWTHVAVTWDGETRRLYLDGVLVAVGTHRPLALTPDSFMIGLMPFDRPGFAGVLDELAVFNRALKPDEIGAVKQGAIWHTPQ